MSEEKSDRGYTWDEEEISFLMNIWADENIQQAFSLTWCEPELVVLTHAKN